MPLGVTPCPVPDGTALAAYREQGAFTDCYRIALEGEFAQSAYVEAFYTTWLFKLERLILARFINRPSTDAEAAALARGATDNFAAWRVEHRGEREILLSDFVGRTRSWLMSAPADPGRGTLLYFGSAIVPTAITGTDRREIGWTFRALSRFHHWYSIALLAAARSRLRRKQH